MRKIALLTTLIIFLLSGGFIYGQKAVRDSVCVHLDGKAEINLAIYHYKDLADQVKSDFKSLQFILNDTKDIPEKASYTINYEPNKSLTIKQTDVNERVIWENDGQASYRFNNQCNIRSDNYYLKIQFSEIEDLISDSLIATLLEVIDTTNQIQSRYAATYNYTVEGNSIIHNNQFDEKTGAMDMLMLKGGVGVNLIKSEPVIDISAEIGLAFNKKGILKNQYYLSYNLLFDFMEESNVNLNGFLNVGYRYNLSKKVHKPNWLGVELGYLVNRQGDLFGKDTFKLGVNWELGKYISIAPQLYMSGDFTEFYPAVRVGIGF